MNQGLTLSLATLLALVTLTACSNDDRTTTSDPTASDDWVAEGQTSTPPGEDILGDGVVPDYSLEDTVHDDYTHAQTDLHDDMSQLEDDMSYVGELEIGIPFDEMVENGKIHDTDGILTDGENAQHDDFIRHK